MVPKYHQKNDCRFIKFDISELYPSISEEVLEKSINSARSMTNTDDSTIQIIRHARKSLLFDSTGVWVKNDDNPLFDVTMGSFDGAEVCELVGLYLLSKISVLIDSDNVAKADLGLLHLGCCSSLRFVSVLVYIGMTDQP